MNDKPSRGFLIRLGKARFENEETKNRAYWNPRGSLIKQTSHYSCNLTLPNSNNKNSNKSLTKYDENITNKNNSILGSGSDEKNKNIT